MLSGVAEMERGLIRERTASGRRAWAARGVMPARARSPFGYHIVNHKDIARGEHSADALGKYVLVPDEARWMPEVFARFAGGASLRQVAAWLNQQGVRPPGGKEWHGTGIRRMLINPVYKGIAEFGRLETVYDERRVTERGLATDFFVRKRPEETWIRLSAPALVDEALWAACQEQLGKNQQVYGGNPERKFMLSGLVRCPVCGYRMGGDTCTNRRGTKTRSYKCYPSRKCGTYQNAPALEHSVVKAILWAAEHPEHIAAGLRAYDKQKQNNDPDAAVQRRQELEAELARLDARAQATARAQVTALMAGASENDFTSLFTEIRQRREALEAELRGIAAPIIPVSQAEPETAARKVATVLGALEEVLTAADEECTPAEKQALLAKVVDRITPDGEQVSIALRSETVPIVSTMTYPCRSSSACAAASPKRPRAPRPSPFVLPAATQVF
jgi:site-specific DNA recombinase